MNPHLQLPTSRPDARRPGASATQESSDKTRSSIYQRYKRNACNLLLKRRLVVPLLTVLVILVTPAVVFFVHPASWGISGEHGATIRLRQEAPSADEAEVKHGKQAKSKKKAAKKCNPSPLWEHDVDESRYEYGCPEIEVTEKSGANVARCCDDDGRTDWKETRREIR